MFMAAELNNIKCNEVTGETETGLSKGSEKIKTGGYLLWREFVED